MDPASSFLLKTAAVLVLIGTNAFFVAAEFALVAVRRTRIDQRVREGDRRARHVAAALDRPDDVISAAQLGITVASIAIGYLAESTIHQVLFPYIERASLGSAQGLALPGGAVLTAHAVATILTLGVVTYLHVVLGEQVPKMISIQRAEFVALWTARPILLFVALFRPFIRLMAGSTRNVVRSLGLDSAGAHPLAHTPDELRMLVEHSQREGMVEDGEKEMIHGVFTFRETVTREVMTPRPDIVALPIDADRDQVVALIARHGHSRIPVYAGSLDNVAGMLLVKDLILHRAGEPGAAFDLRSIMREPCFVPDTKRIDELLAEFRSKNVHLAIVIDEFGGTAGLVTLEDLLEEIVGDINDEYDLPEPEFTVTPNGDVLIDGGANLAEVNERFHLGLADGDFDTIGGYIFGELGRVPVPGDTISLNHVGVLRVEDTQERRVMRVRLITRNPALV